MKALITLIFISISSMLFADQLAYITKVEADHAIEKISKVKHLYLFCGCCSLVPPEKVTVIKAFSKHTGYEEYYEVFIEYLNEEGDTLTGPIDLAYVWAKKMFSYKTIGQLLKLEHDYCVKPNDWSNPKHIEEDI